MTLGELIRSYRVDHELSMRQFAKLTGVSSAYVSMIENNLNPSTKKPIVPSLEVIQNISNVIGLSVDEIIAVLGDDQLVEIPRRNKITMLQQDKTPLTQTQKVPLIGRIACGTPILAEQNIAEYVHVPEGVHADFALTCVGDSMIGAHIESGDIVFIRSQPVVENREIAAVLIGEEATLKRIHRLEDGSVILLPENPAYAPMTLSADPEPHIIGKATAVLKVLG